MSENWKDSTEKASGFWIWLLARIALLIGRRAVMIVLIPVTLVYLVFARSAARASVSYLARVHRNKTSWWQTWRHFYCFALVSVDRFYFISGKQECLDVDIVGEACIEDIANSEQGCILLVSHLGSFDALRAGAASFKSMPFSILMDHKHNAASMKVIDALNPEIAQGIIDSNQSAPALALTLAEKLQARNMIGIMADRLNPGEEGVVVDFLDGQAQFPTGPWKLASVLKVPVFLCFGLYLHNNCYRLHIEKFSSGINVSRKTREHDIAQCVQLYAEQLEEKLKLAPYNWFNFYEFWIK